LWDVTEPAHPITVGPLTGHTGPVTTVAFSKDGHTLLTGSQDTAIRPWDLNLDHAVQRICATTRNTLTRQRWNLDVSPQLPYHPPCP
jgi:WD40 repeat protein